MGLFSKKKEEAETISQNSEEYVLKEELESEVEKLQQEYRTKQTELEEITQKIQSVKEEYDSTVGNLMIVKKELNQKKMEHDIIQRECKEMGERIKNAEKIKDSKSIQEFKQTEENLEKLKQKLDEFTKKQDEIKEEIEQGKLDLHNIRKQQIDAQKELDEANSRLYNAKEELNKKDQFEDTDVLTPKEREFIAGEKSNEKSSAGIIEAASAVVGSLKSKLSMTEKELETVQLLLEKEREDHQETKKELDEIKTLSKKLEES
ncbi:DNA repair protein [Nitrosopumilus ureiphilus]|uniref:DNA repair protein n=1 Tax=Nitrosopumilus ureiphilus TaxID=1470067 RepID=A0A7D5RD49_9ARCH|nr:DNA repair protein [Nitrosopumilus ureiphilus]QLH06401.1 DNA repair protein [Nitrosopumilus ureiphilus]